MDTIKLLVAAVALAVVFIIPDKARAYPGKIVRSIDAPGSICTGLTWDGNTLWVAGRASKMIFAVDPSSGEVVRKLSSPAYWPMGMTWDGEALWNIDVKGGLPLSENYQAVAYRINPETGMVLRTVKLPVKKARGVAWDGKYLWVADESEHVLVQLNSQDGTTIRSFPSPTAHPCGLTFDGTYLYVSDRYSDEIYMVSAENGMVLQILQAPGKYTFGLAVNGNKLYAVDSEDDKIYEMVKSDRETYRRYNQREVVVTHTHQAMNFGPNMLKELDIHLAVPVDRPNQEIKGEVEFSEGLSGMVKDQWGQQTAHFHRENVDDDELFSASMTIAATLYEVRYFIDPAKVGNLEEIPEEVKEKYLANNEKYQYEHPYIQKVLKEELKDEENPYWMARKLYNYLLANMYYEMAGGWNTAPAVLERGNGSCSEYTFTYIALCRAAGIPARYVGSVVIRGDKTSMDDVFHRWAEIYLPGYGWIPVDASRGDKKSPRGQADSFGYLDNRFVITTQSGGGSETMEWTYNSNAFWKAEPKTFVVTDHFADWKLPEVQ